MGSKANNRVVIIIYVSVHMYCPTFVHMLQKCNLTTSYPGETGCMLKVVCSMRRACAQALAIFHATFWPMSMREDSKSELGLKDIGRLMKTRDGQLVLQGGADYCQNIVIIESVDYK